MGISYTKMAYPQPILCPFLCPPRGRQAYGHTNIRPSSVSPGSIQSRMRASTTCNAILPAIWTGPCHGSDAQHQGSGGDQCECRHVSQRGLQGACCVDLVAAQQDRDCGERRCISDSEIATQVRHHRLPAELRSCGIGDNGMHKSYHLLRSLN